MFNVRSPFMSKYTVLSLKCESQGITPNFERESLYHDLVQHQAWSKFRPYFKGMTLIEFE